MFFDPYQTMINRKSSKQSQYQVVVCCAFHLITFEISTLRFHWLQTTFDILIHNFCSSYHPDILVISRSFEESNISKWTDLSLALSSPALCACASARVNLLVILYLDLHDARPSLLINTHSANTHIHIRSVLSKLSIIANLKCNGIILLLLPIPLAVFHLFCLCVHIHIYFDLFGSSFG